MSLIQNYEYIRDWVNNRFLQELQSYYNKSYIDSAIQDLIQRITDAIAGVTQIDYVVCESTHPVTGKKGTIYFVPSGNGENVYDEYLYIENKWEKLGPQLDLSSKQDVIQDLSTIRSGATAGSTAYQKPINGIPAVDLTNDIQTSLNKADSAVQHAELTEYVQSTPIGPINPTITPGVYATKEEIPELINNLTTNDATKGLSAAQGVVLDGKISQLDQKVDDLGDTLQNEIDSITPIVIAGDVINAPDQEDLTTDNNLLKFKNRVAGVGQMGYKILRKDASFASQVTDTNTIYEIRYDFDLNNATVTIPLVCVLKFNGGKLRNGTIAGIVNIEAPRENIFQNITVSGRINGTVFPEWYIVSTDADDTAGSQKALDVIADEVSFASRTYNITSLTISSTGSINVPTVDNIASRSTVIFNNTCFKVAASASDSAIIVSSNRCTIRGRLVLDCLKNVDFGIKFLSGRRFDVSGISIFSARIYGILFWSNDSGTNNDFGILSNIEINRCGTVKSIQNFTIGSSNLLTIPKDELDLTPYATDLYTFDAFYQLVTDDAFNPAVNSGFVASDNSFTVKTKNAVSTTVNVLQGGGICFIGSDSQRINLIDIDIINAPIGVRAAAIYGNTFSNLSIQSGRVGVSEGSIAKGVWPISDVYINTYFESLSVKKIVLNATGQRVLFFGGAGFVYGNISTDVLSAGDNYAGIRIMDSYGDGNFESYKYFGKDAGAKTLTERTTSLFYDSYTISTARTITIGETAIPKPRMIVSVGTKKRPLTFVCADNTKKINGVTSFTIPASDRWVRQILVVPFGNNYLVKELTPLVGDITEIRNSMNVNSQWGTTVDIGDTAFDKTSGKPYIWNGSAFVNMDGTTPE